VRFHLFCGEHGFKLAHQVGGTDDVLAKTANELNGARINHRDVHDVVIGRVLHGDVAEAAEHGFDAHREFLPSGIEHAAAGQRIETALFNAVQELARLAVCGNEVIPAAGYVRTGIEAQDVRGNGIAMMVIVEEPAVNVGLAQRSLNGVEIHALILAATR
jgi:hypothetical protein